MTAPDLDPLLAGYAPEDYTIEKHSPLRKTIARRLTQSKQTVPHFYVRASATVDALLAKRAAMNEAAANGEKLSINDFMVRAFALAF